MPGIDREILTVMVEGGGYPCGCGMTRLTIGWELGRSVRRIGSLVVIVQVTPNTGIRGGVIVPVMALVASGRDMCAGQWPVIIVNRECGRTPARVGSMAITAGRGNVSSLVIRIGRPVICIDMTGGTSCRCSDESVCMTSAAQEGCVGTCKREAVIMVEGSAYAACRVTRIACKAVI